MGRCSPDIAQFPIGEQAELLPVNERCLTEVDNLNKLRLPDGSHAPWVIEEIFKNLIPFVKEGGVPNAVHRAEHPYQAINQSGETAEAAKAYMWLGRTAIQNAESGRAFHKHPEALKRVAVEIDEARDADANLRPGFKKIFISPRMSRADASYEVAKAEHLGDEDSVRCSQAVTDEQGNIQKRIVESLLVRDIPLEAWVAMLADPDNIFGKSIGVDNPDSALSVMKTHRELELPADQLPEGTISVIEAVLPYIRAAEPRSSVARQLERLRENQADIHTKAANIAKRWLAFETALADSLHDGRATLPIESFINSMQDRWNQQHREVILAHQLPDGHYEMSRDLAVIVEKGKRKMLWIRASVVTGNEKIINQLDPEVAQNIYRDEMFVQTASANGNNQDTHDLEAQLDRQIAGQKVKGVGGGCAGTEETEFNEDPFDVRISYDVGVSYKVENTGITSLSERKTGRIKKGRCVIMACPTRPRDVKIGSCGVCVDRCQKMFDSGKDPNRTATTKTAVAQQVTRFSILGPPLRLQRADTHEFRLAA